MRILNFVFNSSLEVMIAAYKNFVVILQQSIKDAVIYSGFILISELLLVSFGLLRQQ